MIVTNPPNVNLSQVVVDAGLNLSGGDYDIVMKAGRLIDGKDVSGLMVKETYDPNSSAMILAINDDALTVAFHQALTATGDANNPNNLNNSASASETNFSSIGHYVEIDFTRTKFVKQFRIDVGEPAHAADGELKIQYWDGTSWVDWKTGITTITAAKGTLSAWEEVSNIATTKIRIVCVTVDTRGASADYCNVCQFEVKW